MRICEWNLHAKPLPRTYRYIRWRRASTRSDFCFGADRFVSAASIKQEEKKISSKLQGSLWSSHLPPCISAERSPCQSTDKCCGPTLGTPTKSNFLQHTQLLRVSFKMSFRPCASGCGSFLTSDNGHDRCLTCLGCKHAETAFVDGSCPHCEHMSMATLSSTSPVRRVVKTLQLRWIGTRVT